MSSGILNTGLKSSSAVVSLWVNWAGEWGVVTSRIGQWWYCCMIQSRWSRPVSDGCLPVTETDDPDVFWDQSESWESPCHLRRPFPRGFPGEDPNRKRLWGQVHSTCYQRILSHSSWPLWVVVLRYPFRWMIKDTLKQVHKVVVAAVAQSWPIMWVWNVIKSVGVGKCSPWWPYL